MLAPFGEKDMYGNSEVWKDSHQARTQRGLKSGPFWPMGRPHLASCKEQHPLQSVPISWLVTNGSVCAPRVSLTMPVWGSTRSGAVSERVSSVPFLHRPTEPVRSASSLYAPGQTPMRWGMGIIQAQWWGLSWGCHACMRAGGRQCQLRDNDLSPWGEEAEFLVWLVNWF